MGFMPTKNMYEYIVHIWMACQSIQIYNQKLLINLYHTWYSTDLSLVEMTSWVRDPCTPPYIYRKLSCASIVWPYCPSVLSNPLVSIATLSTNKHKNIVNDLIQYPDTVKNLKIGEELKYFYILSHTRWLVYYFSIEHGDYL